MSDYLFLIKMPVIIIVKDCSWTQMSNGLSNMTTDKIFKVGEWSCLSAPSCDNMLVPHFHKMLIHNQIQSTKPN